MQAKVSALSEIICVQQVLCKIFLIVHELLSVAMMASTDMAGCAVSYNLGLLCPLNPQPKAAPRHQLRLCSVCWHWPMKAVCTLMTPSGHLLHDGLLDRMAACDARR